jgi:two-component system response regulator AtoC
MPPPFELESIVDIYDQPFVVVDHRFRIVAVNRAFELTYDVHHSTAKGSPCYSLIRGEHRPCPCDPEGRNCPFLQVFDRHHKKSTVRRYLDNEGREHIIRVQAYPLRSTTGEVYIGKLIQHDAMRLHPAVDEGCNSGRMVGESPVFLEALDKLRSAASADAPVLLLGETGTGKELAAAYVHRHSRRRDSPFQTLDCTALTNELFESGVFGHERGSFTGNVGEKTGLFELATGGPFSSTKSARCRSGCSRSYCACWSRGSTAALGVPRRARRTSGSSPLATGNSAMPLTSAPISTFRIACLTVTLPILAERRDDIPLLATELVQRISQTSARPFTIEAEAIEMLQRFEFPGNVRELRNLLWVAAVNARGGHITAIDMAVSLSSGANGSPYTPSAIQKETVRHTAPAAANSESPKPDAAPAPGFSRRVWEANQLAETLRRHNGNRRAVAEELGVSERTVYRKLREYSLS